MKGKYLLTRRKKADLERREDILCSGEDVLPSQIKAKLKCRYKTGKHPFLLIGKGTPKVSITMSKISCPIIIHPICLFYELK